jgi:hypothetical protein
MDENEEMKAARPWPIVNRPATVAELDAAEKFLEVVSRTQQDGPCFRHLSILIGDAQSRRSVGV